MSTISDHFVNTEANAKRLFPANTAEINNIQIHKFMHINSDITDNEHVVQ